MMILSRMWYAILAILVAAAFYIVSLAVGQYNRRNHVAMVETLQADAQVADFVERAAVFVRDELKKRSLLELLSS